jgi:hypothetical protein
VATANTLISNRREDRAAANGTPEVGSGYERHVTLSLLVGLWLSFLHALAGSPASPTRETAAHLGRAAESSVSRNDPQPISHALRAARVVVVGVSAAGWVPVTHPTLSAVGGFLSRPIDGPWETRVRDRALYASHAIAARGAVLPYFATAPPLQG